MSPKIALACAAALAAALPAHAAEWRNVGMDLEVDLQSVKPDATGFLVEVRHTNVQSEGMPPPAVKVIQHYRFDCRANTAQGLDVTYFDASGTRIGGGPYPPAEQAKLIPIRQGGFLGKIETMICPTLHLH